MLVTSKIKKVIMWYSHEAGWSSGAVGAYRGHSGFCTRIVMVPDAQNDWWRKGRIFVMCIKYYITPWHLHLQGTGNGLFRDESQFCITTDDHCVCVWRHRGERTYTASDVERYTGDSLDSTKVPRSFNKTMPVHTHVHRLPVSWSFLNQTWDQLGSSINLQDLEFWL